ncbi:MAG TPA: hypothetical protein VK597_00625 [Inquilinus sp.]|nr:hypothetical protein [Inquilinus sp.]
MSDGLASHLAQSADHFWVAVLRWGYPNFPLWVLGLVSLSILVGWPGERPHDDKTSHHTLWWRLRIGALGAAIPGVTFCILYRMLAYRVLTPDSAAALLGDLVDRWWLLAIAVPCLALVLRIGFVRYGRPWLSSRLRDARISQRTDLLSDICEEVGRWGATSFGSDSILMGLGSLLLLVSREESTPCEMRSGHRPWCRAASRWMTPPAMPRAC